jgi:glycosyltransferase involved in cell wall biosynthesis
MSLPRISIVTPSFNQGQYLEETLKSVLSQGYSDLEYIVIDGGSTDNTLDVIKRYEQEGITYWVSEKDRGQSDAINKGLRRATGEIVTWLNSDDMFMPDALHSAARHFQESDAALIHGQTVLFGKGFKEQLKGADEEGLESRYLAGMPYPQPSSFFRRSVLLEQGYLDETLHYGMDYDLLARIALNYPIRKVSDIFSRYRLHDESKSVSQNIEFTRDWARTFSRVLHSISHATL